MSGPWLFATTALWLLLVAVTIVLARLLRVVASLDRHNAILRERVGRLEGNTPSPGRGRQQSPARPTPSVVHVTLESDCPTCRDLALDVRVSGLDGLGVPVRVLVEDDPAGRELAAGLPVPVEYERTVGRQGQVNGVPHVFVLSHQGAVLAKGNPDTVSALIRLAQG